MRRKQFIHPPNDANPDYEYWLSDCECQVNKTVNCRKSKPNWDTEPCSYKTSPRDFVARIHVLFGNILEKEIEVTTFFWLKESRSNIRRTRLNLR
jgi:hypothetical protein